MLISRSFINCPNTTFSSGLFAFLIDKHLILFKSSAIILNSLCPSATITGRTQRIFKRLLSLLRIIKLGTDVFQSVVGYKYFKVNEMCKCMCQRAKSY